LLDILKILLYDAGEDRGLDMDNLNRLRNRQLARLLSHLEKTGQLTLELEKDLKRSFRFWSEDVEILIKGLDKEIVNGKKQD